MVSVEIIIIFKLMYIYIYVLIDLSARFICLVVVQCAFYISIILSIIERNTLLLKFWILTEANILPSFKIKCCYSKFKRQFSFKLEIVNTIYLKFSKKLNFGKPTLLKKNRYFISLR